MEGADEEEGEGSEGASVSACFRFLVFFLSDSTMVGSEGAGAADEVEGSVA